jgi:hypothetical protein
MALRGFVVLPPERRSRSKALFRSCGALALVLAGLASQARAQSAADLSTSKPADHAKQMAAGLELFPYHAPFCNRMTARVMARVLTTS